MLTDYQKKRLNADLPPDEVKTREGGSDKALSFVEGWRVIDLLNDIIGVGEWSYRATVERVYEATVGDKYVCTYLGRCVLTVGTCVIEDVGAGQGKSKQPGDAIEKAAKEAATDALKRCAKSLGRRMGLALYDKEQRHVENQEPQLSPKGEEVVAALVKARSDDEMAEAKKRVREAWSSLNKADRDAVNGAIAERKKQA